MKRKNLKNLIIYSLLFVIFCSGLFMCPKCKKYSNAIEPSTSTDTVPGHNYTVVIDAGHGGTDPGSIGYKSKAFEADSKFKNIKNVRRKIKKNRHYGSDDQKR